MLCLLFIVGCICLSCCCCCCCCRNTCLLAAYGQIDPRVRALAFLVKHWSRQRHINSPSDGTLSSYGYLLLLIHFLQRQAVAVLPNLQDTYFSLDRPARVETHPVDPTLQCNTYFFEGPFDALRAEANKNKASVAELLVEFFRYFAWVSLVSVGVHDTIRTIILTKIIIDFNSHFF